jgi:hypothetical protein
VKGFLLFALCGSLAASAYIPTDTTKSAAPGRADTDDAPTLWEGLIRPVAIQVASDGLVYIADQGDNKVRVYSAEGRPIREFGQTGDGPGEFRGIRNLTVIGGTLSLFDAKPSRVLRMALNGQLQSTVSLSASGDEMITALGAGHWVLASSARWGAPAAPGAGPRPLARIVDTAGVLGVGIGAREASASPFAAHIRNFVIPAGTRDGALVWLARLNSPEVLLYRTQGGTLERIQRTLPFRPRVLPDDFVPSKLKMTPGKPFVSPFDAVTFGIATDAVGRAYILTALEGRSQAAGREVRMAVDILTPGAPSSVRRLPVPGAYSAIGVSPNGKRLYLVDQADGEVELVSVP